MKSIQKKKSTPQVGKWVEKVTKTAIVVCVCGNKYLKTRKDQVTCVRCIFRK